MIGYFDMDKLDKILYNLLSNAAKYNKEDGFIQVSLSYDETDKDFILLKIKDNGKAFQKRNRKIFLNDFMKVTIVSSILLAQELDFR